MSGNSSTVTGGGQTNDNLVMNGGLTVSSGGSSQPVNIVLNNLGATLTSSGTDQYSWTLAQVSSAPTIDGTALGTGAGPNTGNLLATVGSGGSNYEFALDTTGFTIDGVTNPSAGLFTLEFVGNGSSGDNLVLDYNATPEPGTMILVLGGAVPMLMGRRRRKVAKRDYAAV